MTDRLLNLVSAIEENLNIYNTNISPLSYGKEYDYLLTLEKHYAIDDYSTSRLNLDFLDEHSQEFCKLDVTTGINEDGVPLTDAGDDVGRHWVELRVKE